MPDGSKNQDEIDAFDIRNGDLPEEELAVEDIELA